MYCESTFRTSFIQNIESSVWASILRSMQIPDASTQFLISGTIAECTHCHEEINSQAVDEEASALLEHLMVCKKIPSLNKVMTFWVCLIRCILFYHLLATQMLCFVSGSTYSIIMGLRKSRNAFDVEDLLSEWWFPSLLHIFGESPRSACSVVVSKNFFFPESTLRSIVACARPPHPSWNFKYSWHWHPKWC